MAKKSKEDNKFMKIMMWIIILAIVFIITFWATPKIVNELRTVEYGNLTFTKTHYGEIPVYYYWYNYQGTEGKINRYNLYLRLNPADNPVEVTGNIVYPHVGRTMYASINKSSFLTCQNAGRELTTLSMFIRGNDYQFEIAYLDNQTAVANSGKYITCENKPKNPVLEIAMTNRTVIEVVNDNCYKLEFKDCDDFLNVIEKFEVQSLVDAKNRSLNQ